MLRAGGRSKRRIFTFAALCGGGVSSSHPSLGLSVFFLSFFAQRGSKRKIRGTHNSCYEVVMLAVITTSGMCYECYEVLCGVMRCYGRVGIIAITAMEVL